jgi:hypothetical protein
LLNNYFESEDKLSKEEQIAFRVFVKMIVSERIKEHPYENSYEQIQLNQDTEYKILLKEEKELNSRYETGEKVKTKLDQKKREIRKIENKYEKRFINRILSNITQTDPLVNAVYATYGWSLTVHKCIGSTFTNTILNAYQGENRGLTNADYYRWLYSGITATSGVLRIVNPQIIHPLMEVHFEDTTTLINETINTRSSLLSFNDYQVADRFKKMIPSSIKSNVTGSICEFAKLLEHLGYLLESINSITEYLTKANFSIPETIDKKLIIAFTNKGPKDNWAVSAIKIEKSDGTNERKINGCIEGLYNSVKKSYNGDSSPFPTDFRGNVYKKWEQILTSHGFQLSLIESHNNQDVFMVGADETIAKFRVWYFNNGFISQFIMLEKKEESMGEMLKNWLLNGN